MARITKKRPCLRAFCTSSVLVGLHFNTKLFPIKFHILQVKRVCPFEDCNLIKRFDSRYLSVEYELQKSTSWPVLNKELPILPITPSVENFINEEEIEDLKEVYSSTEDILTIKDIKEEKEGMGNPGFDFDEDSKSENMITKF